MESELAESDEMLCPNPECDGIARLAPGSHNAHGKNDWWTRRKRWCAKCGKGFMTHEGIIPGSEFTMPPMPESSPDSDQKQFAFDADSMGRTYSESDA